MRYIVNYETNPYFNLALDEYMLEHVACDEDFFVLWQNRPAVIIGKNQSALAEINEPFIQERDITVARRVTGGGAVYHDFGNICFTFVTHVNNPEKVDYARYCQPIIDALADLGVKAEMRGRNDIVIEGKKISGNAQKISGGKLMHHGTLLFDENLEDMFRALNVDPEKYLSKGIQSIRSRVTNIKDHLHQNISVHEFWDRIQFYLSDKGQSAELKLTPEQLHAVHRNARERFSQWEWIYGSSPAFSTTNSRRIEGTGLIKVFVDVQQGRIAQIRLMGDYLGISDVLELETKLIGTQYNLEPLVAQLEASELYRFFGKQLEARELAQLILGQ